jgi:hypothetical protein
MCEIATRQIQLLVWIGYYPQTEVRLVGRGERHIEYNGRNKGFVNSDTRLGGQHHGELSVTNFEERIQPWVAGR